MTPTKETQRKVLSKKLSRLSIADITKNSQRICQKILQSFNYRTTKNIATFAAHGTEPNLTSLHNLLPTQNFLYPLCHPKGILSYHHVTEPDELLIGKYGIREPDPSVHPEIDLYDIDLFLCPGLGFSTNGYRLGHGGGYYDRALEKRNTTRSVDICGIGFHLQLSDELLCEKHDIQMDYLITEKDIFHCQT